MERGFEKRSAKVWVFYYVYEMKNIVAKVALVLFLFVFYACGSQKGIQKTP